MSATPCPNCPVAGLRHACPALVRSHARYCELMDPAHPDHAPHYGPVLREMAAGPSPTAAPRSALRVALTDAEIRARAEVETCPSLEGCHCDGSARCSKRLPPDDGPATMAWCLACVAVRPLADRTP